jgi:sec-independent protein translocase protein TatB
MMGAMSFSETIFLFFLALIVFGPKKLPEIARQAGKLLAELRRASNEFKSQIETEIAHLEVQKNQTVLPPAQPPQGAVASLSLNPAASEPAKSEPVKQQEATLAGPETESTPALADSSDLNSVARSSSSIAVEKVAVPDPETAAASQDSHV